jgi:hypothetical protein
MKDHAILSNCLSVSKAADGEIIDSTVTFLRAISSEFPVMMLIIIVTIIIIIIIINNNNNNNTRITIELREIVFT